MKKLIITLTIGLALTGCATKVNNKITCKDGVCTIDRSKNTKKSSSQSKIPQNENIVEITAENFNTVVLQATKPVVVDFYATWCGPCKAIKPLYAELANEQSDWVFAAIDVDKAPELAAQCGVQAMPTFVVFKNGTQWGAFIGGRTKDQFMAELNAINAKLEPTSAVQSKQTKELMQYIYEKNIDEIKKLIDAGVDVNIPTKTPLGDLFPLQAAILSGTKEIIDLLLNAGATADDSFEAATLKYLELSASTTENTRAGFVYAQETEQALSKPVAESSAKLASSDIAQQLIAAMADPAKLAELITAGADVNKVFSAGGIEFTPLYMALITNNQPAIKMLITAGATLQAEIIAEPNGKKKTIELTIKDLLVMYDNILASGYSNLAYVLNK